MNLKSRALISRTIRAVTALAFAWHLSSTPTFAWPTGQAGAGRAGGAGRAEEPRLYVPTPGQQSDVNGDGLSDVDNILRKIDELATVGVKFDDEDKDGNVPMRRKDGKYHMACIDLLNVCYRAAGIDVAASMAGAKLLGSTDDPKKFGSGRFRQIVSMVPWLKRNPNFHFYSTPAINLVANRRWKPSTPMQIGDMIFVHYDDENDRHSGIVTGVDPATGRPTHVSQVSIYNENQGLHRATIDEFFALKCRMLTGFARPASWDGAPMVDPIELRPPVKETIAKRKPGAGHGASASAPSSSRRRGTRGTRAGRSTTTASRGQGSAGLAGRMGNALGAPLAGSVSAGSVTSASR